ncbi:uncharacterized protein [Typha angustifolia]|uniref:uncharacterized protein n=1 Tax=Typha angustifolia TaxID=59011 RepID=UPI003C2C8480
MRLPEFIPWGRRSGRPDPLSSTSPSREAAPELRTGNTSSRRRRASHTGAESWKPSLEAISENTALAATVAEVKGSGGGGPGKARRRSTGGGGLPRTNHEDSRNFGVTGMTPPFTPMSFLF